MITLRTAPECIRRKIVKAFLAERGAVYDSTDCKDDAQEFNAFCRVRKRRPAAPP